jgi:hypothetical protein
MIIKGLVEDVHQHCGKVVGSGNYFIKTKKKYYFISQKIYIFKKIIITNEEHIRQLNQKSFLKLKGKI